MSTGKQGSAQVTVTYDDASGTPRAITNFVMNLGGAEIDVEQQSSEAFGDAWKEFSPTGMRSVPAIPVGGLFDTTATTGPHVVMAPQDADADPNGSTRTLVIVFGDSKTFTVETRLNKYMVQAKNGALTEYTATVQPTGVAAWT